MANNGWIKLHRKILDNPKFGDKDYFTIWVKLLLYATHKDRKAIFGGKEITLVPGQLITGRTHLGVNSKISDSKVQRILKWLENAQQIEQQTTNQNRLITILNWSQYQDYEQQAEQQVNNERTTSEQRVNTYKNDKNIKNDKNDKKREVASAPTPSDKAKDFFSNTQLQEDVVSALIAKGVPDQVARKEVSKFVSYWTELNKSGTKQRWQMEKAFEVNRRLATWFGKVKEFNTSRGDNINIIKI